VTKLRNASVQHGGMFEKCYFFIDVQKVNTYNNIQHDTVVKKIQLSAK